MNKSSSDALKKLGTNRRFLVTIILLVVSIVLMAAIFGYVSVETKYDKEYVSLAGEQRVLSQRIAKYALEASSGKKEAFELLRQDHDRFQQTLNLLQHGNPKTGLPATKAPVSQKELKAVQTQWKEFDKNIQTILNGQEPVLSVRDNAKTINDLMPQILADSDEVVSILVDRSAPPLQIYKASVQLMLSQRIANNVNKVLAGGEGSVTAADRFGRDITIFGNVLSGMLRGDATQGIVKVTDSDARQKLEQVSSNFAAVTDYVGAILQKSPELFEVQDAAGQVTGNSDDLIKASTALVQGYTNHADHRMVYLAAFGFGGIALVMLIALGVGIKKDADRRTTQSSRIFATRRPFCGCWMKFRASVKVTSPPKQLLPKTSQAQSPMPSTVPSTSCGHWLPRSTKPPCRSPRQPRKLRPPPCIWQRPVIIRRSRSLRQAPPSTRWQYPLKRCPRMLRSPHKWPNNRWKSLTRVPKRCTAPLKVWTPFVSRSRRRPSASSAWVRVRRRSATSWS
jgi:hypothetical protein